MRATIDDAVFTASADTGMDLLELLNMGRHSRHRIVLGPAPHPNFTAWLAGRPLAEQERIDAILKASLDAESRTPAHLSIRIVANIAVHATAEPTYLLQDALPLLRTPFRVVLEDEVTDRAFLLAAATEEDRAVLEQAEREHWLHFHNGGGLESIARLFNLNTPSGLGNEHARLRVFLVFDSDRLAPGTTSKRSDDLARRCTDQGLDHPRRHHQLRRRAIENYLPLEALERRQESTRGVPSRKPTLIAWRTLEPLQAHHYNMKTGFDGDSKRLTAEKHGCPLFERAGKKYPALYEQLSDEVLETLSPGFGRDIAEDFKTHADWYAANPSWRHRTGVAEELDDLLDCLLGAL